MKERTESGNGGSDLPAAEGSRGRSTATSSFGVGRRESHDATAFYSRFNPPLVSNDADVVRPSVVDQIFHGDARAVTDEQIADNSVALMVTSPPYFAGKEYEEDLGQGHVPATYLEYLEMLRDVFSVAVRKLEAGGRMAVNVANLGRKPYRSLSADVMSILQDDLGLLLRGEIVWQKARGAAGSCAWGSFQSPANPVLRDLTERIIVASKGRFDRALSRRDRARQTPPLPSEGSIFKDDFLEATTDLWEIPPESAIRVGHPAPFPVELPKRLIELYTYRDDLVYDPFMGSGTTAIAAIRTDRHYVGFDTDDAYVALAGERVAEERRLIEERAHLAPPKVVLPAFASEAPADEDPLQRAVREGAKAQEIGKAVLKSCGFEIESEGRKFPSGVEVNYVARDKAGVRWYFDVSGAFTSTRAGLRRTDTLWKALGKAAVLGVDDVAYDEAWTGRGVRLVFLSTDLPEPGSAGGKALAQARGRTYFDAIEMLSLEGQARLARYAAGGAHEAPEDDLHFPATEQ